MKKYIITTLVLLAIGVGLFAAFGLYLMPRSDETPKALNGHLFKLSEQNTRVDELVIKSRYGLEKNYDALANAVTDVKNRLGALRVYSRDVPELADNTAWQDALARYSDLNEIKNDAIESFKTNNAVLRNSVKYIPQAGDQLRQVIELTPEAGTLLSAVTRINQAMYEYLTDPEQQSPVQTVRQQLPELENNRVLVPQEYQLLLAQYISHIRTVLERIPATEGYVQRATTVKLAPRLDTLIELVGQIYPSTEDKVRQGAIGLGVYALVVMLVLLILLKTMRDWHQHMQSLQAKESKVSAATEQVKTMSSSHMELENVAYDTILSIRKYIPAYGELFTALAENEAELKAPKPDGKKLGAGLKKSVSIFSRNNLGQSLKEVDQALQRFEHDLSETTQTMTRF